MSYKKITFVLIISLILCSSTAISTIDHLVNIKRWTINDPPFIPENITLADDAFHESTKLLHIETWYFDAKLDDNSSMVCVICLFRTHCTGSVLYGFYLYNDTKVEYAERKMTSMRNCLISYDTPFISIGDTLRIKGYVENETDLWKYEINYTSSEVSVQVLFTRTSNGWKGVHQLGWWLAIPGLDVDVTTKKNDSMTHATGKGYHDHNIYPTYVPFLMEGYHFGSISGETLRVTWANIGTVDGQQELLVILSQDETNFTIIDSSVVTFQILSTMYEHGVLIPKTYRLTIVSEEVNVNLTFETISTHFIKVIGVMYWRYHLNVSGFISSTSTYDKVEGMEISELLKFFV
jgi:hypothetical protein